MPAPRALHEALDNLSEKYKGNEHMTKRLAHHINHVLPAALSSAEEAQRAVAKRRQDLAEGSEQFMAGFLAQNRYFYLPHPEVFLRYDGEHFTASSDDDIQHQILSEISQGGKLRPWKHKVARALLKSVRERSPLDSIPESPTIQAVLNSLVPAFFSTRDAAKYFITVVGDGLRSHETHKGLVYLTPPCLRELVRALSVEIFTHFGSSSALQSLKFKHYDHSYAKCRLLPPGTHHPSQVLCLEKIVRHSIDFLCVSAHYSVRFGGADGFLANGCHSISTQQHALYLCNSSPEALVESFISTYVQPCPQRHIQTKNMIFIWKKYLSENRLPSVIFHSALKELLKSRLEYNEAQDVFVGVTSPYVPMVAAFLKFWDTTIVDDPQAQDEELETDELRTLFRHWAREHSVPLGCADPCLLELIHHFYPDVHVEDGRVLVDLRCRIWDKQGVVRDAVDLYLASAEEGTTLTLSAAYSCYVQRPSDIRARVGKRFFEKHARDILGATVDKDGVVTLSSA